MTKEIMIGIVFGQLSEYFEKYEITFQFWGEGRNIAFIEKDGIDLWNGGKSFDTPLQAMIGVRNYLDRINKKEREYNPNF